jgi:hypothetical protein
MGLPKIEDSAIMSPPLCLRVFLLNPFSMMHKNLFDLTARRILITGSNGGIGYSLALGLAEHAATVILNGRNAEKLHAAAEPDDLRRWWNDFGSLTEGLPPSHFLPSTVRMEVSSPSWGVRSALREVARYGLRGEFRSGVPQAFRESLLFVAPYCPSNFWQRSGAGDKRSRSKLQPPPSVRARQVLSQAASGPPSVPQG